jgi:isopenicillin N synthase-like dioxygenase
MWTTLLEQFSIGAKKLLFIRKKDVQITSTIDGNVISLTDLIDGKDEAVTACVDAMRTRGWTVVILPDTIRKQAHATEKQLLTFFASKADKKKYRIKLSHLGYDDSDPGKQSLRILTGTELEQQKIPKHARRSLKMLSASVDMALDRITDELSETLFGASSADVGNSHELPLFKREQGQSNDEAAFALLEAAYYLNDGNLSRDDNCAPHYDPGLFSLNVLSNQPGLEFQDDKGHWVAAPFGNSGFGILWAGWAATMASREAGIQEVKAAVHKVVYPGKNKCFPPRLSVWSEICTRDQVFLEDIMDGRIVTDDGQEDVVYEEGGRVEFTRPTQLLVPNILGNTYMVSVKEGRILDALKLVQELKGLPMSKLRRIPIYDEDGEVISVL